jgi:EAL domain-containing protein (putative c-di-GMP-specific phosphodiesterase class I)
VLYRELEVDKSIKTITIDKDFYEQHLTEIGIIKSSYDIKIFVVSHIMNGIDMSESEMADMKLIDDIKSLDFNRDIISFFQPIVDINGKVIKYESLARMVIDGKVKSPFHFFGALKKSNNYIKFTKAVIENSFKGSILLNTPVSINLTFEDLINEEIIELLEDKLANHKIPMTLEFLESEGLHDLKKTIDFCNRMKKYDTKIAIDDFGSGYSNYDYFFDVPIDILKIDGSLVKRSHEYKGKIVLESIISFSNKLGIEIVTEFVEDEETFNILKDLGSDYFQGYYFSKPLSIDELI